jgi:hypothetical protein
MTVQEVTMPLLDHFHPPLSVQRPWEGFHSTWATVMAQLLNRTILPGDYVAMPHVRLGTAVEVDVATLRQPRELATAQPKAPWSPAQPGWSIPIEWDKRDLFEVRILRQEGGPKLVAAIELVSPANKDRPAHRQSFAGKCAGFLRQGVGLVVVDVVTDRQNSLHEELISLLELNGSVPFSAQLYAVAYRTTTAGSRNRLDVWTQALALGQPLPTLPLWLAEDVAVPVDLEASYQETCSALRMN